MYLINLHIKLHPGEYNCIKRRLFPFFMTCPIDRECGTLREMVFAHPDATFVHLHARDWFPQESRAIGITFLFSSQ